MNNFVGISTLVIVLGLSFHNFYGVNGEDLSNPESNNSSTVQIDEDFPVSDGPVPPSNITSRNRCSCGKRNNRRIVGGVNAERNEFPWRCYLKTFGSFSCGCSIISSRWIMIAAHCVEGLRNYINRVTVVVGDHDRSTTRETASQEYAVEQIITHQQYNQPTQLNNDMALIKVRNMISFSSNISPVCLPFKYEHDSFAGTTVVASGWGTTSEGGRTANTLQKVDLPVLSNGQCSRYFSRGLITENMICTYNAGKDACQGDSGGSIDLERGGNYYAIGVVSFGIGCARHNSPGVYARTTKYLNWIRSQTGETFCQP